MRTYLLFALFVALVLSCAAALRATADDPGATGNPPSAVTPDRQAPLDQRQVLVRSQILEVSRTKLCVLGFDLGRKDGGDGPNEQHPATASNTTIATFLTSPDGGPAPTPQIQKFIDALLEDQLAKVMSTSKIVVTTGKPASFHTGPELPIRVDQPNGERTVEMIKLGTVVNCKAQLRQDGTIQLEHRHTIRDAHGEASSDGVTPKLRVTEFDTRFDLPPGKTGVMSQTYKREEAFKRGTKLHKQENELEVILIVTAELVEARTAKVPNDSSPK
jgi:pilus assembly protein CpaC